MRAANWAKTACVYARECERARDFHRVIGLRLSQEGAGWWAGPRPVTLNLRTLGPEVHLRSHSTDLSVLSEMLVCQSLGALPEIPDARTVVDLGANIGLSYRFMRRRYPRARFVCVEPDPANVAALRTNASGCEIVAACIGASERQVALTSTTGEWGYRMSDTPDGAIPVITMDRLCEQTRLNQIDVLKCDIEGAESELFADCSNWIGRVRSMIVECHVDVLTARELTVMLAENGCQLRQTHLRPSADAEVVTFER